jgi:hypothetical protein
MHFAEKQGTLHFHLGVHCPHCPSFRLELLCVSASLTFDMNWTLMNYHRQPPPTKKIPPKNYSENFVYKPNKLRIMRTK